MKSVRFRPEGEIEGTGEDTEWEPRRHHARFRIIRPAFVVVDDAALECVLVDISPNGVKVCLVAWTELPDRVTLLLPNAGTRPMRRIWQQGSFSGFEALGDGVPLF